MKLFYLGYQEKSDGTNFIKLNLIKKLLNLRLTVVFLHFKGLSGQVARKGELLDTFCHFCFVFEAAVCHCIDKYIEVTVTVMIMATT